MRKRLSGVKTTGGMEDAEEAVDGGKDQAQKAAEVFWIV
jgi:hypothetical protein